MPKVKLPDGAVKEFDAPVSVAEVAAAIGPGLAKAALAGKVDGKIVDTSHRIDRDAAVAIVTDKDADGLHPTNLGRLVLGVSTHIDSPLPCTPAGIVEMLQRYGVPIAGKHVVVVGRGLTVGRPPGLLLTRKGLDATVTLTRVPRRRSGAARRASLPPSASTRSGTPMRDPPGACARASRRPARGRRACRAMRARPWD